jgi:hypothetical protein
VLLVTIPPPHTLQGVNVEARNSGRKTNWLAAIVMSEAAVPITFKMLSRARSTTATTNPFPAGDNNQGKEKCVEIQGIRGDLPIVTSARRCQWVCYDCEYHPPNIEICLRFPEFPFLSRCLAADTRKSRQTRNHESRDWSQIPSCHDFRGRLRFRREVEDSQADAQE